MSSNRLCNFGDSDINVPKMSASGYSPSVGFVDDLEEDCAPAVRVPLVISPVSCKDSAIDDIYSKSIDTKQGSRFPAHSHFTKGDYGHIHFDSLDKTVDSGVGQSLQSAEFTCSSSSEPTWERNSEPDILQKFTDLHLSRDHISCNLQQIEVTPDGKATSQEHEDDAFWSQESCYNEGSPVQTPSEDQLLQHLCVSQAYQRDEDGDTLLHMAIIQGEQKWALYFMMIATSADLLNIQNQQQQTPLHLAVLTQQHNLVEALVAGGADLEMRDRSGNTALHLACRTGDLKCVRHLTTPPGGPQYRTSATQLYSYAPSLPTTIQDLAIKNYEGKTCLHIAAAHSHANVLEYLVRECGADINLQEGKSGRTVLHQTVESNNMDLVQVLLHQPGLQLDALTYDSRTALCLAVDRQLTQICCMLREAGANMSQITPDGTSETEVDMMEDGYDDFSIGGQPIQSWT